MNKHPMLALNLSDFSFNELFTATGLNRLDSAFLNFLQKQNPTYHQYLLDYRRNQLTLTPVEVSEWLIACAKILEVFIADLFQIQDALTVSQIKTTNENPLAIFKKYYVLKRARKELNKARADIPFAKHHDWLLSEIEKFPLKSDDLELTVALLGVHYLAVPDQSKSEIDQLVAWCISALTQEPGKTLIKDWVSFKIPSRIDYQQLVKTKTAESDSYQRLETASEFRYRDGFKLTDPRMSARAVQDEVNYCIYCHDHEGDFCSRGFPNKKGDPSQGFKKNPLDITLTGCPLEEKISEMHLLKSNGHTLGSLAMIMIDNPLCPATGHRICNDCMKACIYQKQDPVNIPQIETRVLTDVLDLPWGVEIYDLLTRWNPLRKSQWVMKPYNGLKILIAGMGPAGFTLAHHLLLEGFAVVGFDGLKIESLPNALIETPIYSFAELKESLDERLMAGFGGVAEYGITVRWDKNFLKLIYLSLLRRPHFQVFGHVRFGGTIHVEDAWKLGFDHLVVAVGAGLPKALAIPESLNVGMRQANDFLMALQLGNAAKETSLNSLQIRLPAVVIGGGLTGVDTATELQAYYIRQVEKIAHRYHQLLKTMDKTQIFEAIGTPAREILMEFLAHAAAIKAERQNAAHEKRSPNFIRLLREWGGVTIVYRKSMKESPAYINNHEELQKALEEGIYYSEGLEPLSVSLDEFGHTEYLNLQKKRLEEDGKWIATAETVTIPARAILAATGTQPNTAYEFEHRGTFNRLNLQYQHYEDEDGELTVAHGIPHCKAENFGPFTSYQKHDYRVSLVGDTHPIFHGNVVKAIASGLRTYPKILNLLAPKLSSTNADATEYQAFRNKMNDFFQTTVVKVDRKSKNILELVIKAPSAVKNFQHGQFYRLQNFEQSAPCIEETELLMEPLALIAAKCDKQNHELTFYVYEQSTSAKLCRLLTSGDPVSLMGPTGVRAKIPKGQETILIVGEATSIPFFLIYSEALKEACNRVIYFCQVDNKDEIFCLDEIKKLSDYYFLQSKNVGQTDYLQLGENIIEALIQQSQQSLPINFSDIDRVYIVGSSQLLKQFQNERNGRLKNILLKDPKVYGSVYGNMQCMLKGVCAQCLQWQINPETKERSKAVFACSWQDQPLEIIDIDHMAARSQQNHLHETINRLWVDYLFAKYSFSNRKI